MNDPFMKRVTDKEFFKGYLQVKTKTGLIAVPFNYSIVSNRSFTVQNSLMQGMEFVQPNETIRTTNIDLPIANGMVVVMQDNRNMTVLTAMKEINPNKAYMIGNGDVAWIITLQGGQS